MKTWHEIVEEIQSDPNFSWLVKNAYFSSNLNQNLDLYTKSDEWKETYSILKRYGASRTKKIVDIGCGNGITSLAFASVGLDVTCIEPDESDLVGTGAIKRLAQERKILNIKCYNRFAESMGLEDGIFDFAFARQSLHHAENLDKYCQEVYRVLKPGGIFMTVRDHVVYDEKDKKWFLESHPLHRYYGGENAYRKEEYLKAFLQAGFVVERIYSHFDSIINFFPMSRWTYRKSKWIYPWVNIVNSYSLRRLASKLFGYQNLDERSIPGRLYTFIVKKV